MYVNTSAPQHLEILEVITALVYICQLHPLWEVSGVPFIVSDKENRNQYN